MSFIYNNTIKSQSWIFLNILNRRSCVRTARQDVSFGLYISGCTTTLGNISLLIFCILFFVCIRSALVEVNTQIFLPAYSFTADEISSDFPYEVGATTETVSSFFFQKNEAAYFAAHSDKSHLICIFL